MRRLQVWLRRWRPIAFAMAVLLSPVAQAADEAALKAAIVFNLMMFAEWPAAAQPGGDAPWVLCMSPTHPAAVAFKALNDRVLRGRRMVLQAWPVEPGAPRCHAAFVGAADMGANGAELRAVPGLLLISDAPIPPRTAAIALRLSDAKLVFSVNLAAARRADIQLSAKLLRLAQGVQE